jgi:hypothetical protein
VDLTPGPGGITDSELVDLIPDTWLYMNWPEQVIGAIRGCRCSMQRGSSPSRTASASRPPRSRPSAERQVNEAAECPGPRILAAREQFRQRQAWHAPTAIYQAVISPAAVLALLERKSEGPPEIIVDPQLLRDVQ